MSILEPAPPWVQLGITEEKYHQRAGVVSALITSGVEPQPEPPTRGPAPMTMGEIVDAEKPTRKPRSDRGVRRGPKAPGEPEAEATAETVSITVDLTSIQYADLEREAARVYRDIEPRYLTESPATVLLNSRVQKHWRTLVGK